MAAWKTAGAVRSELKVKLDKIYDVDVPMVKGQSFSLYIGLQMTPCNLRKILSVEMVDGATARPKALQMGQVAHVTLTTDENAPVFVDAGLACYNRVILRHAGITCASGVVEFET